MADKPTAIPGIQQVTRYANLWRRLFSIKGAPPEPMPVLNLDNSYDALELAAIRGEQCAWGSGLSAAVPANNSRVSLRNDTPFLIARVEQMILLSTVAGLARIGFTNGLGGVNSAIVGPRDNRFPNGNLSQGCTVWTGADGAIPGGLGLNIPLVAGVPQLVVWPAVIVGGGTVAGGTTPGLTVYHETPNTDIFVSFLYRVRRMEPSEVSAS